jgi:hypothetical protein
MDGVICFSEKAVQNYLKATMNTAKSDRIPQLRRQDAAGKKRKDHFTHIVQNKNGYA